MRMIVPLFRNLFNNEGCFQTIRAHKAILSNDRLLSMRNLISLLMDSIRTRSGQRDDLDSLFFFRNL